jgi:predicted DNA-binding protein YlxM (UPF0122 family)
MALARLGTEHYIAINYLALPKRGGKTMQEIADECSVSRQALYKWLDDAMFKLVLQMNDMLTDAINVGDKLDSAGDIDAMQKRIEEYKAKAKKAGE